MKVTLTKDWAGYKKSALIEIEDQTVLDKGFEIGLFEKVKPKKDADNK